MQNSSDWSIPSPTPSSNGGDGFFRSLFSGQSGLMEPDWKEKMIERSQRRIEQNRKQNEWEWELEKIKQQFMNSTPFKTRLMGDHVSTRYDGTLGRRELNQAKNQALSNFSQTNFRKDTKADLFKVEFDIYEYDPETVKVRLEDDNTIVAEARQLIKNGSSHISKKEFYRKVLVPAGCDSNRLLCKLSAGGILTIEIPAPPSYEEAFKSSKHNFVVKSPAVTTKYTRQMSQPTKIELSKPKLVTSTGPRKILIRSATYDPRRTRRQQKISLCDSLDSETTLSSSPPSDDAGYYGNSSFSDLDY